MKHTHNEYALLLARHYMIPCFQFSIHTADDLQCLETFRFTESDILWIADLLQRPASQTVTSRRKYSYNPVEAFCIASRKWRTPKRGYDLETEVEDIIQL